MLSDTAAPVDDLLPVWRALADPTRRAILDLLRQRPMTTGELASRFAMSRFGVMKHLQILVDGGLAYGRRRGRERWNHLNPVPIQSIYRRWIRPFEQAPADALLDIKRLAEHDVAGQSTTQPTEDVMSSSSKAAEQVESEFRTIDVQLELQIDAPSERVWRALTSDIRRWWPKPFYVAPTPRAFVLEAHVGGRVYEDWGDGQGMLFATISAIRHGEMLQWVGDMGPDYGGPARTITTFTLESNRKGTLLKFRDTPFGTLGDGVMVGLQKGWTFLLEGCLKPYLEHGTLPERPDTVEA